MGTSFTGIVYIFLTLGLILVSYRFFLYWKKSRDIISKLVFIAMVLITIICSFGILTGIIWVHNTERIRMLLIISSFFVALFNALLAYLTIYIKFPKVSPWWGFGTLFTLGIITSVLTIIIPIKPYLEPSGGVNWGIPIPIGILRALCYFLGAFPLSIIFFKEWLKAKKHFLKIKSILLAMFMFFVATIPTDDFVIEPAFHIHALVSEVLILIASAISILVYIASIKIRPPKYVKKVE